MYTKKLTSCITFTLLMLIALTYISFTLGDEISFTWKTNFDCGRVGYEMVNDAGTGIRTNALQLNFTLYIPDASTYDSSEYPYINCGARDIRLNRQVIGNAVHFQYETTDGVSIWSCGFITDYPMPWTVNIRATAQTFVGWDQASMLRYTSSGLTTMPPVAGYLNDDRTQLTAFITNLRLLSDPTIGKMIGLQLLDGDNLSITGQPTSIEVLDDFGNYSNGNEYCTSGTSSPYIIRCTKAIPVNTDVIVIKYPVTSAEVRQSWGHIGFSLYVYHPTTGELLGTKPLVSTNALLFHHEKEHSGSYFDYKIIESKDLSFTPPQFMKNMALFQFDISFRPNIAPQTVFEEWRMDLYNSGFTKQWGEPFLLLLSLANNSTLYQNVDFNRDGLTVKPKTNEVGTYTVKVLISPTFQRIQPFNRNEASLKNHFLPFDPIVFMQSHRWNNYRSIPYAVRRHISPETDALPDLFALQSRTIQLLLIPSDYGIQSITNGWLHFAAKFTTTMPVDDYEYNTVYIDIQNGFHTDTYIPHDCAWKAYNPSASDETGVATRATPAVRATYGGSIYPGYNRYECQTYTSFAYIYPTYTWRQSFKIVHDDSNNDIYFINNNDEAVTVTNLHLSMNDQMNIIWEPTFPFIPTATLTSSPTAIIPTLPTPSTTNEFDFDLIIHPKGRDEPNDLSVLNEHSLWKKGKVYIYHGSIFTIDFSLSTATNVILPNDFVMKVSVGQSDDWFTVDNDQITRIVTVRYIGQTITIDEDYPIFSLPFQFAEQGDSISVRISVAMNETTTNVFQIASYTKQINNVGNYYGGKLTITTTDALRQSLYLLSDYVEELDEHRKSQIIVIANGEDNFEIKLSNAVEDAVTSVYLMDTIDGVITTLHSFTTSDLTSTQLTRRITLPNTLEYTTTAFLRFKYTPNTGVVVEEYTDSELFTILPNCFTYPTAIVDYNTISKYSNTCAKPSFTIKLTDKTERSITLSDISPPKTDVESSVSNIVAIGGASTMSVSITQGKFPTTARVQLWYYNSNLSLLRANIDKSLLTLSETTLSVTIPHVRSAQHAFIRIITDPVAMFDEKTYDSMLFSLLPQCKTYPTEIADINDDSKFVDSCGDNEFCSIPDGSCQCNAGFKGSPCEEDKASKCFNKCTMANTDRCDESATGSTSPCVCKSGFSGEKCDTAGNNGKPNNSFSITTITVYVAIISVVVMILF